MPGSYAELEELRAASRATDLPLEIVEDEHFYSTPVEFEEHAGGRKQLVMEHFYRGLRKRYGVLMEPDGSPTGGEWNFDKQNRKTFGKSGPGKVPAPRSFTPDELTGESLEAVERAFPGNPGALAGFGLAVTPEDARLALDDFLDNRLARFGGYQDAMWAGTRTLYHSLLSPCLNLRLLSPRAAVDGAVQRFAAGSVPINSVEGFVRQVLGWREFIRGVYWYAGSDYAACNELGAHNRLPSFFWDGRTDMRCVADVMQGVLDTGYAHHIQRLMVMGLFALLYGADPGEFHRWHLSLYIDAYDWVSAPNAIGMSQFADGGLVATKPYAASGRYISRMSNYCAGCRYDPSLLVDGHAGPEDAPGGRACPFTTLYWEFLDRHREMLAENRRMQFQLRNLDRKPEDEISACRDQARRLRQEMTGGSE
jgi:deoxyribodipyrimidine photolyase-related protein